MYPQKRVLLIEAPVRQACEPQAANPTKIPSYWYPRPLADPKLAVFIWMDVSTEMLVFECCYPQ